MRRLTKTQGNYSSAKIYKTRLLKDFLIINSRLSKSDMIALNKKNDELFLPFVQHDVIPEDGEDAYKE